MVGGELATITSTLNNPSNSAAVKLTATISPTLLVEASMNYDGNIIDIVNSPSRQLPSGCQVEQVLQQWHRQVSLRACNAWGLYGDLAEDTGSAPWHNAAEDYEPKVDISYTIGKHAMKFGVSYNRYTKNQKLFGDQQGSYSFGALSNDSAMDMLLGSCHRLLGVTGCPDPPLRQPDSVGVRDGYLEGHSAPQPATRTSL